MSAPVDPDALPDTPDDEPDAPSELMKIVVALEAETGDLAPNEPYEIRAGILRALLASWRRLREVSAISEQLYLDAADDEDREFLANIDDGDEPGDKTGKASK
jgi:hypothetical protein